MIIMTTTKVKATSRMILSPHLCYYPLGVFLLIHPSPSASFSFLPTHHCNFLIPSLYTSSCSSSSIQLSVVNSSSSSSSSSTSSPAATAAAPGGGYGQAYASDLLYEEQEKLIIKRGILEESLVNNAIPLAAPPSSAIKVRGVGKAGGFGGGGINNHKSNPRSSSSTHSNNISSYKAQGKVYAKIITEEGLVRMDNVLSSDTSAQLRHYLYELRKQSELDITSGKVQPIQRFAHVLLKHNRCDLTIPLGGGGGNDGDEKKKNEIVTTALLESLIHSPVGATISSLFGKEATLHEFSCLMSDPGSQRQVLHPDTPCVDDETGAVLYTCFIALQDVTLDMGPTTWLPRTHTKEMHDRFKDSIAVKVGGVVAEGDNEDNDTNRGIISPKDHLIRNQPAVLGLLPQGSCVIFDSRVLHCGTANRSNDSRALFYFSFKNPKVVRYTGNPASIRKELGNAKVTLGSLMEDLISFERGKGSPLIDRL